MRIKEIKEEVFFCNIGWMSHYDGRPGDQIRDGGSSVEKYEVRNFYKRNGYCYGYVQPPGRGDPLARSITIGRLGADRNASEISGITVVWTARHEEFGTVVIGWYKSATVYRHYQKINGDHYYRVKAKIDDCCLLPKIERTLEVPRKTKGGMGQSLICYQIEDREFCKDLSLLLKRGSGALHAAKFQNKRKVDVKKNKLVEVAAIETVEAYYAKYGFTVKSVESENKGWDLECKRRNNKYLVEVKGRSDSQLRVELTPKEFLNSSRKNYRLAIVCNALNEKERHCRIFRKESDKYGRWLCFDDGKELQVIPKEGAVFSG